MSSTYESAITLFVQMPVEKKKIGPVVSPRKVIPWSDEVRQAARKAFAQAIKRGTPKAEVMRMLGIAQSTYYKWANRWRDLGERWVNNEPITKAVCFAATTARTTRREIVEASLQNPTLSTNDLADRLLEERGQRMSRSTIHNYLKEAGLGTRVQRAAALHRKYLDGLELTPEQERLVETIDPTVRWRGPRGKAPREILIHDVIRVHHSRPIGSAAISVIVDTFDGSLIARFIRGTNWEDFVGCAKEAIESASSHDDRVRTICTGNGYMFGKGSPEHPYNQLLKAYGVQHLTLASPGNRRNPFAQDAFMEIEKFLFEGGVDDPASYRTRQHELNALLQDFLQKAYGRF